jgi:hypothetical protein
LNVAKVAQRCDLAKVAQCWLSLHKGGGLHHCGGDALRVVPRPRGGARPHQVERLDPPVRAVPNRRFGKRGWSASRFVSAATTFAGN